jgi:hypothetical protein
MVELALRQPVRGMHHRDRRAVLVLGPARPEVRQSRLRAT